MPSSGGALQAGRAARRNSCRSRGSRSSSSTATTFPHSRATPAGRWRPRLAMARLWADAFNRRGGESTVVHLPEAGIRGNTHFPFSDLNNLEVADLMSKFLSQKRLDRAASPFEPESASRGRALAGFWMVRPGEIHTASIEARTRGMESERSESEHSALLRFDAGGPEHPCSSNRRHECCSYAYAA